MIKEKEEIINPFNQFMSPNTYTFDNVNSFNSFGMNFNQVSATMSKDPIFSTPTKTRNVQKISNVNTINNNENDSGNKTQNEENLSFNINISNDLKEIDYELNYKKFLLYKINNKQDLFEIVNERFRRGKNKEHSKDKQSNVTSTLSNHDDNDNKKPKSKDKSLKNSEKDSKELENEKHILNSQTNNESPEKILKPKTVRCPPGSIIINNFYNIINPTVTDQSSLNIVQHLAHQFTNNNDNNTTTLPILNFSLPEKDDKGEESCKKSKYIYI